MSRLVHVTVGHLVALRAAAVTQRRRTERGLSQSTENAILLAAALTVAGLIAVVVTGYVTTKLADMRAGA